MSKKIRLEVLASSIAILGVIVGAAVGFGDTTSSPVGPDDPGIDPLASRRAMEVVPAQAKSSDGCGSLQQMLDNFIVGYRICYPSSWGLLDISKSSPAAGANGLEAFSLRLASGASFPWTPGVAPLDAVSAGVSLIEINSVPSFQPSAELGDCTPNKVLTAHVSTCKVSIDPMTGVRSEIGTVTQVLGVLSLPKTDLVVRAFTPVNGDALTRVLEILKTLRSGDA